MTGTCRHLAAALLAAVPVFLAGDPAFAEIDSVAIESVRPIGSFGGRAYREIIAVVHGHDPGRKPHPPGGGTYRVHMTIHLPVSPADAKGFALVDVVNTVPIFFPFPECTPVASLPAARLFIGEEFLFGEGLAYIAPVWDPVEADLQGRGDFIEPVTTAYEVLRDAARLIRNPAPHIGAGTAADHVIGFGYSQTSSMTVGSLVNGIELETDASLYIGLGAIQPHPDLDKALPMRAPALFALWT